MNFSKTIARFFIDRPTLFWSAVVAMIVAGVLSFLQMPKLEDPAVCAKQAQVVVVYPGASAHQVELKAAQVVEDQLRTLPNVQEIRTECQNGMAMITVEFKMTVLGEELEQHFDLLRRKASECRLPSSCYEPIVIDDMMDTYGLFFALSGEGYSYTDLDRYARLIRRELMKVRGVKRINIVGGRDEVINIVLSKDKLSRNGLIPTQIMMSLQNVGKEVDAGKYAVDGERIQLRVDSRMDNEQDIADMLLSTADGQTVQNNWHPRSKTLVAQYSRENALRAGLERSNVADALLAATDGLPVGVVSDQDKQLIVQLQVREEDGTRISDLRDIPVWNMTNVRIPTQSLAGLATGAASPEDLQNQMFRSVPLSSVASDVSLGWEEDFVYRVDGERTSSMPNRSGTKPAPTSSKPKSTSASPTPNSCA